MSISFRVEGLGDVLKALKKKSEDVQQQTGFELQEAANNIQNGAISDAPRDQGLLINEISIKEEDRLNYDVVSPSEHSPFVEFGTKSKVKVPAELQQYAAQFRNQKSSGDAKKMIYDWCKRKGIDEEAWYPIYRSIMVNGINPQPFFFKQLDKEGPELLKRLKRLL